MFPSIPIPLSGERFFVKYKITAPENEAFVAAKEICLEQTVELPDSMVPQSDLREKVVGKIESFGAIHPERTSFVAQISYSVESTGFELTQFLNVLFGNTSMKAGVRLEEFSLPDSLLQYFSGPKYGRLGIRDRLGILTGAILGTAIKPQGFPPKLLAESAYKFALGGIDVIKDDHGLADQSFAPFKDRVERCAEAVHTANQQTGRKSIYVPNITGPSDSFMDRALFALKVGAGGLEVAPGLAGWDSLRLLAQDKRIQAPVFFHPAFLGTYTISKNDGIALGAIFGQIPRLAGADVVIYTHFGGRFPTTAEDCTQLKQKLSSTMGTLKSALPMPGGGMTLERVPELIDFYGEDVILLVSGGLYGLGPNLVENCSRFRRTVDEVLAANAAGC